MARVVSLQIRHAVRIPRDDSAHTGRVQAFAEEVDLDDLTPRARALAEALADAQRAPLPITRMTVVQENSLTVRETHPAWDSSGQPLGPDQHITRSIELPRLAADRPETAAWWLEHQARDHGPHWYTVSAVHGDRVPSWEAAASDRHLTVNQVLERLRDTSAEIGIRGWDTLRGTGILRPDRHVQGSPQWRPEDVDAFIARPRELWPISQVAEYLGFTGPSATGSARKQLSRWGLVAEGRGPGRGGESLYAADQIQAAHNHRPGRGTRTDLREEKPGF